MKKNLGGKDRVIRTVLGGALLYYAFSNWPGSDAWRIPAGIAGGILWLTVMMSWCPIYKLLGINTHPSGKTWSFLQ